MATLEIDLNCMCLLVPDPSQPGADRGTVHVLMPCTHHAGAGNLHIVQMDYMDPQGTHRTVRLEGWGLELGDRAAPSASLSLARPDGTQSDRIVDITERTRSTERPNGRLVPRAMLTGTHPDVVARISLHGGMITDLDSQWPDWVLGNAKVTMAHKLLWRMQVEDEQMTWTRFNGSGEPPLASLAEVKPVGAEQIYRLHVHHVATKAIDAATGLPLTRGLNEEDIQNHFRMFYMLLGEDPRPDQLPALHPDDIAIMNRPGFGGSPGWACKIGKAQPES
jgi:hypothetical protein